MKRLPLFLVICLCTIMFILSTPFLIIVYLLGGNKVFSNYCSMLSLIYFGE